MASRFLSLISEIESSFGEIRLVRETNSSFSVLDNSVRGLLGIQMEMVTQIAVDTYFKCMGRIQSRLER